MGARAKDIAEGLLHSSRGAGRLSDRADAIMTLVAVGDGPTRDDWDYQELPPWALHWPDGRGNALPTELAVLVAERPETYAAAMSPGARRELLEALSEIGDDGYIYLDYVHVLPRRMVRDYMRRVGYPGDFVRLSDLGRSVAVVLEGLA
jgi:hypothetical protein